VRDPASQVGGEVLVPRHAGTVARPDERQGNGPRRAERNTRATRPRQDGRMLLVVNALLIQVDPEVEAVPDSWMLV
ncbi:hypothetical protein, partial [Pseudomonas sp. P15-2025]|uniref:hypothetical protein n=1 Tax=Pseudomonas sp. P15-2025 TaxID=3421170 RepID=UPI003FA1F729